MSGTDVPPIAPPPLEAADHAGETRHPTTLTKTLPIPSGAWVLYDTANTVYAAVLTYLFAPYVGDLFDGRTIQGITNSVSMIVAGLCVPVFASLADHTGRARLYLIMSTMACVLGLAGFGVSSNAFLIMAAFFVANVGYNAALVFYNSLLASVASDRHQGLVSGLGVGLGYIGTMLIVVLLGLPDMIALWVDPGLREAMLAVDAASLEDLKKTVTDSALLDRIRDARSTGLTWTFVTSAGLFFVLALPCFLLVRERRVTSRKPFSAALVRQQFASVLRTVKGLPKDRAVMWFLIGNFFCVDVLNTAILFFGDFTRGTFFINEGTVRDPVWVARGEVPTLFGIAIETPTELLTYAGLSLNFLALLFGITLGFMTDRFGSLRVLRLSAAFLVLGLVGAALGGGTNLLLYMVGICGFGALGLAGIWTAGRKLLIELSPREKLGEYFGLYGITTKLSVMGSAVFGIVFDQTTRISGSDLTGWKTALLFQAVPLVLGLGFLMLVRSRPGVGGARAES